MGTRIRFLILYLIPILSVIGTYITYGIGYGTRAEGLINFSFTLLVIGLISELYITIRLISHFLANKISYLGVIFTILGFILELLAFAFYLLFFQMELTHSNLYYFFNSLI
jgi:hypothetical protein